MRLQLYENWRLCLHLQDLSANQVKISVVDEMLKLSQKRNSFSLRCDCLCQATVRNDDIFERRAGADNAAVEKVTA